MDISTSSARRIPTLSAVRVRNGSCEQTRCNSELRVRCQLIRPISVTDLFRTIIHQIRSRSTHEPNPVTSSMKVWITAPIPPQSAADDHENPWNVTPLMWGLLNAMWKQYESPTSLFHTHPDIAPQTRYKKTLPSPAKAITSLRSSTATPPPTPPSSTWWATPSRRPSRAGRPKTSRASTSSTSSTPRVSQDGHSNPRWPTSVAEDQPWHRRQRRATYPEDLCTLPNHRPCSRKGRRSLWRHAESMEQCRWWRHHDGCGDMGGPVVWSPAFCSRAVARSIRRRLRFQRCPSCTNPAEREETGEFVAEGVFGRAVVDYCSSASTCACKSANACAADYSMTGEEVDEVWEAERKLLAWFESMYLFNQLAKTLSNVRPIKHLSLSS